MVVCPISIITCSHFLLYGPSELTKLLTAQLTYWLENCCFVNSCMMAWMQPTRDAESLWKLPAWGQLVPLLFCLQVYDGPDNTYMYRQMLNHCGNSLPVTSMYLYCFVYRCMTAQKTPTCRCWITVETPCPWPACTFIVLSTGLVYDGPDNTYPQMLNHC